MTEAAAFLFPRRRIFTGLPPPASPHRSPIESGVIADGARGIGRRKGSPYAPRGQILGAKLPVTRDLVKLRADRITLRRRASVPQATNCHLRHSYEFIISMVRPGGGYSWQATSWHFAVRRASLGFLTRPFQACIITLERHEGTDWLAPEAEPLVIQIPRC